MIFLRKTKLIILYLGGNGGLFLIKIIQGAHKTNEMADSIIRYLERELEKLSLLYLSSNNALGRINPKITPIVLNNAATDVIRIL